MLVLLKPVATSLIVSATALFMCPGGDVCPEGACDETPSSCQKTVTCEQAVTCTATVSCDASCEAGKVQRAVIRTSPVQERSCRVIVNGKEIDSSSCATASACCATPAGSGCQTTAAGCDAAAVVATATRNCTEEVDCTADVVCVAVDDGLCTAEVTCVVTDEAGCTTEGACLVSDCEDGEGDFRVMVVDGSGGFSARDRGDDQDCCCCCCADGGKGKGAVVFRSAHPLFKVLPGKGKGFDGHAPGAHAFAFRIDGEDGHGDDNHWFAHPGTHDQVIKKKVKARTHGKVVIVGPDGETRTFEFGDDAGDVDEDDQVIRKKIQVKGDGHGKDVNVLVIGDGEENKTIELTLDALDLEGLGQGLNVLKLHGDHDGHSIWTQDGNGKIELRGNVIIKTDDGQTRVIELGDGDHRQTIDLSRIREKVGGCCGECANEKSAPKMEKRQKRIKKSDKRFI